MATLYNEMRPSDFNEMLKTTPLLDNLDSMIENKLNGGVFPNGIILHSNYPGLGKTTISRLIAYKLNPHLSNEDRENILSNKQNSVCFEVNCSTQDKSKIISNIEKMKNLEMSVFTDDTYVFVFNEAHKLTDHSQAALLEIEDITDNVICIFTTTDIKSIRPDLLSRFEQYQLLPPDKKTSLKYIRKMAIARGETLPDDIAEKIYLEGNNSIRQYMIGLSSYISTGNVASIVTEDDNVKVSVSILLKLINKKLDKNNTKHISWLQISKTVDNLTVNIAPEQIRINMLQIMSGYVKQQGFINELTAAGYTIIFEELSEPLSYPYNSQLSLKMMVIYARLEKLLKKA